MSPVRIARILVELVLDIAREHLESTTRAEVAAQRAEDAARRATEAAERLEASTRAPSAFL